MTPWHYRGVQLEPLRWALAWLFAGIWTVCTRFRITPCVRINIGRLIGKLSKPWNRSIPVYPSMDGGLKLPNREVSLHISRHRVLCSNDLLRTVPS